MKIGPEHVGKKVRHVGERPVLRVLAIHGKWFWAECPNGLVETNACNLDWQLVEESKLPSKRIKEIYDGYREAFDGGRSISDNEGNYRFLQAINTYLDEQFDKGVLK